MTVLLLIAISFLLVILVTMAFKPLWAQMATGRKEDRGAVRIRWALRVIVWLSAIIAAGFAYELWSAEGFVTPRQLLQGILVAVGLTVAIGVKLTVPLAMYAIEMSRALSDLQKSRATLHGL
jgi:hypothetical protein